MTPPEPTVDGRPVLSQLPAPRNVGFSGPAIATLQWVARQLVAIVMIPVGVVLGCLGILEELWRKSRRHESDRP